MDLDGRTLIDGVTRVSPQGVAESRESGVTRSGSARGQNQLVVDLGTPTTARSSSG